ncbi:MAG: thiamine pyrophosphate-binding protein, partial [Thermoanaerobaculia bacterium]
MTARLTGAELVVRALVDEGVSLAFGIPGTHNIELYDVLASTPSIRAVLVTDEQSASFMADAAARATGQIACVNVVPGAGLTHAMSGIAEAFLDGIPMLVLGCGIRRDTGKAYQLHDVDQIALARPVTKAQLRPGRGAELYDVVRRACRIARAGVPGPVFVEVPADQYLFRHDASLAPPPPEAPPPAPADETVALAAKLLGAARRPLLYLGLGAAGAAANLVALAERLESPVATTFQGKGVFPESHPLWLWPGFGDAAPPFARAVAASCDATLAIGCRFGEVATGSYGISPRRPLIHVDIDPAVPGRNFPADLPIAADADAFVAAFLAKLPTRPM